MTTVISTTPLSHVYDIKLKYEPFYVEYHVDEDIALLPKLFNQQHIHDVAPKVYLCDPAGNMFQIAVEKLYDEAYLTEGWTEFGKFYGLDGETLSYGQGKGGWARLVFVACDMFLVQLRDRLDQPCNYPLPAQIHRLDEVPVTLDYPLGHPIASHYSMVCKKPALHYTLEKTFSKEDVTSGFLQIPVHFCQAAFRESGTKILMFDEYGKNTTCIVEWSSFKPSRAGITRGWEIFCLEKAYLEGLRVELAVPRGSSTIMTITVKDRFR